MKTKWLTVIAFLQMAGGALGVWASLGYLFDGRSISTFGIVISIVFVLLYITSLYGGWLLWKEHPQGITLSMLVQFLQVPQLSLPDFSYLFISPVDISLVIRSLSPFNFGPDLYVGSQWSFFIGPHDDAFLLGLNLFSVFVLGYLHRKRQIAAAESPLTQPVIGFNRVQCPECGQANLPVRMKCSRCRTNLVEAFRMAHEQKLAQETRETVQLAGWLDWSKESQTSQTNAGDTGQFAFDSLSRRFGMEEEE